MTVYIYEKACPLCKGDVKGNDKFRYFCKSCNLTFEKKYLAADKKKKTKTEEKQEKKLERTIAKKPVFEGVKELPEDYSEDIAPIEELEPITETKEELPPEIVASAESDKMHISTCHFIRKIQEENRIHLDSLNEGIKKGYVPCVCIRRKGLMKVKKD